MKRLTKGSNCSTIVFDCDDVLLNWQRGFRLWMSMLFGRSLDPAGPRSWNMDEWVGEDAFPLIERFNASNTFTSLQACVGAREAVARLYAAGHELHVVSACSDNPIIVERRIFNLDWIFGDVFTSIVCVPLGFPKTEALAKIAESSTQPRIWIEDNYQNALVGHALGFDCWMMRRPHNVGHEANSPRTVKWVNNFDPILGQLLPATAVA